MFRLRIASVTRALSDIMRIGTILRFANAAGFNDEPGTERQQLVQMVEEAAPILETLSLSRSTTRQLDQLKLALLHSKAGEAATLTESFYNAVLCELTALYCIAIAPEYRENYVQRSPQFGNSVMETFPDAKLDIAAAHRCAALNEWTACVFHSMRTLEYALVWLKERVGLDADEPNTEHWKNALDRIERRVREMESDPKSSAKSKRLKLYAALAVELRHFKDAWRNHVMHSHAHYDASEGKAVLNHVGNFMRAAAKGVDS